MSVSSEMNKKALNWARVKSKSHTRKRQTIGIFSSRGDLHQQQCIHGNDSACSGYESVGVGLEIWTHSFIRNWINCSLLHGSDWLHMCNTTAMNVPKCRNVQADFTETIPYIVSPHAGRPCHSSVTTAVAGADQNWSRKSDKVTLRSCLWGSLKGVWIEISFRKTLFGQNGSKFFVRVFGCRPELLRITHNVLDAASRFQYPEFTCSLYSCQIDYFPWSCDGQASFQRFTKSLQL